MQKSLKSETTSGILWSSIERFSLGLVQFTINLLMARLLLPSDYGLIGMLAIFLQISQAFVDAGFTNALIQRSDRTDVDYSTAFYFNVVISVVFYGLLFFLAPWIAFFYDMSQLTIVIRVVGLNLIINSLSSVHKTILTINIDFKTQSKASILASILSGGIGLWMAYVGCGVWALVTQTILNNLILTVLFHRLVVWRPIRVFSMESFGRLFSFGSKYLVSNLINTTYVNLYTIVIGKKFSAVDLGYYTYANQIALLPSGNLSAIIGRVMFPILSRIQDEDERLKRAYREYISLSSYVIFPLMTGLAVLARPIIELSLTDKWSDTIILLQILCFSGMFSHISVINTNLLYVKGYSGLALKLEIITKVVAIIIFISSVHFGLIGICLGRVVYSLIAILFNTYYTKLLIGLTLFDQIKTIFPSFVITVIMGVAVYIITKEFSGINELIIGVISGVFIYISFSVLLKVSSYKVLLKIINK